MPNVTLEGIAALLKEEFAPVNARLDAIEHTQTQHTAALVEISTDVKTLLDHKIVTDHRLERLEHWGQEVGQKVGVKLEL